ncbi:MAG: hypothetical protein KF729_02300 [Sandaracinaceae bacterium]|nr:hypothetical protein [Sandaracinaceae bacterium]
MIRREVIGRATTPEGGVVELVREASGFVLYADARILMTSRTHGSEEAMARIACHHVGARPRPRVLVGGLGMGFTLRAALDRLPADAEVVCAELLPAIVEWHRGPLGPLARQAIDDPRVRVVVGDVAEVISAAADEPFDAILLDVDNGPIPMTVVENWWLYAAPGLAALRAAVQPEGVLVVWSAGEDDLFRERLVAAGFATEEVRVAARTGRRKRRGRGETHVLWIGTRGAST